MKITAVQNKNPKTLGRLVLSLLILGFSFSQRSSAAVVTYIGTESSNAGNNYVVHHWSLASVSKQYDFDGNNKYGSAGYYQIRPMPAGSGNLSQGVGNGNLLGTDAGSNATLYSTPSFLLTTPTTTPTTNPVGISGKAGSLVNFNGYPNFFESTGTTTYGQGALSVAMSNGPFNTPSGSNTGHFGEIFQFTVSVPTIFRIGITVNAVGGGFAPDYVSIYNSNTGSTYSTLLTRDSNPDMAIFEINALAEETYTAALWRVSGNPDTSAAFSMITFDTIPEPSTALLALVGMGCLAIHSRRRR